MSTIKSTFCPLGLNDSLWVQRQSLQLFFYHLKLNIIREITWNFFLIPKMRNQSFANFDSFNYSLQITSSWILLYPAITSSLLFKLFPYLSRKYFVSYVFWRACCLKAIILPSGYFSLKQNVAKVKQKGNCRKQQHRK